MSYPFGSGMPSAPLNNPSAPYPSQQPFGAGLPYPSSNPNPNAYPHSSPSPYPPSNNSHPSPYPPSNNSHSSPYPPHGGGMPQPHYPPHNAPHQPTHQPGYPPQMPSAGGIYPSMPTTAPQTGFHGNMPMPFGAGPPPPPSNYTAGFGHNPNPSPYPSHPGNQQYPNLPMNQYSGHTHNISHNPQIPYASGAPYPGGCPTSSSTSHNLYNNPSTIISKSKGTPIIVPAPNFNATTDAQALRKAMKGFGTDEDALINVICRRTNTQRQEIIKAYKTNFGKDLIEDIKSETSGNFENLLVALLTPIVDYYVKELHDAMSGAGTDEDVLIEVLASLSNYEINVIKNAYQKTYFKNLESELMSETSGNFKRLLVSLCTANRDESGHVDVASANRDATELLKAGELRVGTDESTFNMVLCQRNYDQLRLIMEEYRKMTGHGLEKAIKNEFSGDIKDGLLAIVQCVSNKAEFFASRLQKSMAGIGTNDNQLIRVIVTRSEIDLGDIKVAFERLYGKSLRSWIKGDTSGHYKHALYALIGEERSS